MNDVLNLLSYNIKNIQYEYRIANATISAEQNLPTHDAHFTPAKLSIHTEQPKMRQDSTAFFASIGLHKIDDLMDSAAEKGRQAVLEAMGNYSKVARQMSQIEKGVTPAQIYRQKLLEQTKTSLVVKPTAQISFSYTPGEVSMQYTPSSVTMDWNVDRAIRRYTPADFRVNINQAPEIDFFYQGGFQYVPESATPGYNRLV
ncbi:MAG: DUF6470 family protein [Candidatus Fimivivens sp.]|nr:DUF6470 family protein [Candidatus Fimivivens sp.]